MPPDIDAQIHVVHAQMRGTEDELDRLHQKRSNLRRQLADLTVQKKENSLAADAS